MLLRGREETPLLLVVLQRVPINRHRRPLGRNVSVKLGNVAVLTPLPRDPCQFKHWISLEVRHLKRLGQHVPTLAGTTRNNTGDAQDDTTARALTSTNSLTYTMQFWNHRLSLGSVPQPRQTENTLPPRAAQFRCEQHNSGKEAPLDKGQTV